MKTKRLIVIILLLVISLSGLLTACIENGNSGSDTTTINDAVSSATPNPAQLNATQSINATATVGAQEFFTQLTAIADERNRP